MAGSRTREGLGRESRWPLFAQGGPGDTVRPGPWQVMVLTQVSGPDGRCAEASDDEALGVLGRWAATVSWAESRKLAVLRELIRRRPGEDNTGAATDSGLPWDWDDRLTREVALELGLSVPAARKLTWAAWALEARLPGIGRALEDGRIDLGRARMIVEETDVLLDPALLAAAEELILVGLGGCRTWTDLLRLVQRAVVTVDPDGAAKRREREEKENARVRFWREAAGTCALLGAGLPTDEALKAHAHVDQRAQQYRAAGVKRPIDILRVAAYLDLLNLVPPADRIARFAAEDAAAAEHARQAAAGRAARPQPSPGNPGDRPGEDSASDRDARNGDVRDGGAKDRGAEAGSSSDRSARGGSTSGRGAEDRSTGHGSAQRGSADDRRAAGGGSEDGRPEGDRAGDAAGDAGRCGPDGYPWDFPPDDGFPAAEDPCGGCRLGDCPCRDWAPSEPPCPGCGSADCECDGPASPVDRPAHLQGAEASHGSGNGADGTSDEGNSGRSGRQDGGHADGGGNGADGTSDEGPGDDGDEGDGGGSGRPGGGSGGGPGGGSDPGPAVAAEVNLTLRHLDIPFLTAAGLGQRVGEARSLGVLDPALARRIAEAAARHPDSKFCLTIVDSCGRAIGHGCCKPRKSRKGQRDGPPPPSAAGFTLTPSDGSGPPGGYGSWVLTLPGRAGQYVVDLHPVPTGECGHQYESSRHDPGGLLRHLVIVRDGKCGFPACSRPARESDFEHARPFDQGGKTCGCNGWSCSRSCHQVKQSDGWDVQETRPGWHQWTTPSGRTYTQQPWRYPA